MVGEDTPTYAEGDGIDLAEGGAGIRTAGNLKIGDTVQLQIPLPIGSLRVPACVRYQSGSEYGFEFLALGVAEREYIRDACRNFERID